MPIMNIKNNSIGIGQLSSTDNSLNINETWKVCGYFPIGSLFFNVNNIDPSTYFGGIWERYGNGRVLVGVNENDTDFATVNKTGGAKTVTLTTAQMPQHDHQIRRQNDTAKGGGSLQMPLTRGESDTEGNSFESNTVGSGGAHNNLMPFVTCYIWRRIA